MYSIGVGEAMNTSGMKWPQKTRELKSVLFDSTRWNGFRFRDDDIVVVSWSKTGTTLTQQLVFQLIFAGKPGLYGRTRRRPFSLAGWTRALP